MSGAVALLAIVSATMLREDRLDEY